MSFTQTSLQLVLPQSPFPPLAVGFFGLGTGYLVYGTNDWYVGLDDTAMSEDSDALVRGKGRGGGGFHLYAQVVPPPPAPIAGTPAATVVANAGKGAAWVLKHPGLLVWIGASNANEADLQALSAPVTMSGAPPLAAAPS